MTENEICVICQDQRFVSKLSEALTGTAADELVHGLVQKANTHEISNEQFFGELITRFGETKVAQAVLAVIQEKEGRKTTPTSETPAPASEQRQTDLPLAPPEKQAQAKPIDAEDKEKMKSDKAASDVKGVCGVCVGRPLLGMLLTLEEWFVGKDRDRISELIQGLEYGTKSSEDIVSELYCALGQGAVDGINRIIRDINVVLEEGKDKAIKQKPELADMKWG